MSAIAEVEVMIVHETDDAYLVDNSSVEVWLLKSLVAEVNYQTEFSVVMTIPENVAIDKGLV